MDSDSEGEVSDSDNSALPQACMHLLNKYYIFATSLFLPGHFVGC